MNIPAFVSEAASIEKLYPGSVLAVEDPNEVNDTQPLFNGGTSLANEAELQAAFYAAVRADAVLDGVPVYNLSMAGTTTSQYQALGNLSPYANYANSHAYPYDIQDPGFSLSINASYATIDAPGLPEVITETGYTTNIHDTYSGVDQTVQLMDSYKDGYSQVFLYVLFNDGTQANNSSDNFGLFNFNGTPKLSATAIHDLTTILSDPNPIAQFTPGSLNFSVSLPANVHDLLFQKSTGVYDLVLWAEADIWNNRTDKEIIAKTEKVTVHFSAIETSVQVYDPLSGTSPIHTYHDVNSVVVSLTDHPIILGITP